MKEIEIIVVPNLYFDDQENEWALWGAFHESYPFSSRDIPDAMTRTLSGMYADNVSYKPHFLHDHQIWRNDDGRSLRNFMKSDGFGRPKYKTKNMNFKHQASTLLQKENPTYRNHVVDWSLRQTFDEGDDE